MSVSKYYIFFLIEGKTDRRTYLCKFSENTEQFTIEVQVWGPRVICASTRNRLWKETPGLDFETKDPEFERSRNKKRKELVKTRP